MSHPADCTGPVECWGYEPPCMGDGVSTKWPPADFPSLLTYARCFTCGYTAVTVNMPDGTQQRVTVCEGTPPGRLPL